MKCIIYQYGIYIYIVLYYYILDTRKRASCHRVILPFVHISTIYVLKVRVKYTLCVCTTRIVVRLQDDACHPRTVHLTWPAK